MLELPVATPHRAIYIDPKPSPHWVERPVSHSAPLLGTDGGALFGWTALRGALSRLFCIALPQEFRTESRLFPA